MHVLVLENHSHQSRGAVRNPLQSALDVLKNLASGERTVALCSACGAAKSAILAIRHEPIVRHRSRFICECMLASLGIDSTVQNGNLMMVERGCHEAIEKMIFSFWKGSGG